MERISQMLKLQQKLNDFTGGQGWEEGFTNKGKIIDWKRCIYLEAAELIDSYPWKHWKNIDASPDYENIKIELVDIWHFIMSEALRIYKIEQKGDIDALTKDISSLKSFNDFSLVKKSYNLDSYKQIGAVEEMMRVLFCNKPILELIDSFFVTLSKLNLKLPELYKLYVGKNILNQFRQDHGYKEGIYIKKWDGVEDNVIMQQFLEKEDNISPEKLYNELENIYNKLNN